MPQIYFSTTVRLFALSRIRQRLSSSTDHLLRLCMRHSLITTILSAAFLNIGFAQTLPAPPAVTYSNQVPSFAAGHDYIQMAGETVNPANGSVSLRIALPLPSARGMGPTFNISYDSASMYGIQPAAEPNFNLVTAHLSAGIMQAPPDASGQTSGLSNYGWTDSVPSLQASRATYRPAFTFNDANDTECPYTQGYVFTDATGSKHAFNVITYGATTGSGPCDNGSQSVHVYSVDRMYQAVIIPDGPVNVAAADGTTFSFTSPIASGQGTGRVYPQSIEDRNGNRIDGIGQIGSTYQLKDTLGRSVLSIASSFGSSYNSPATSTYSVASLPQPFTMHWATQHIYAGLLPFAVVHQVGYNCANGAPSQSSGADIRVPSSLNLPDGTQYGFEYDPQYGLLSKIIYSNGGFVSYEWAVPGSMSDQADYQWSSGSQTTDQDYSVSYTQSTCSVQYQLPMLKTRRVSFDGSSIAQSQTFSYTTSMGDPTIATVTHWSGKTTTVVTTDGITGKVTTISYAYTPSDQMSPDSLTLGPGPTTFHSGGAPAVEGTVITKDGASSILRTQLKTWLTPSHLSSVTTRYSDGSTTETDSTFTGLLLQPYETKIYDFGAGAPGSLLRRTVINYASFSETPNFPGGADYPGHPAMPSLLSFPSQALTYDGTGNLVAETDYGYDETEVTSAVAIQHDDNNYGVSSTASRANLTSIIRKCWPNCSNITTSMAYDTAGQVIAVTDSASRTTSFSYADSFISGTGTPSGATDALLTSITLPSVNGIQQQATAKFGFNDSKLRSITDANSNTTTYCYTTGGCSGNSTDAWLRLTEIVAPDGGGSTATYTDLGFFPTMTVNNKLDINSQVTNITKQNGYGQLIQTQLASDPQGTVYVDSVMDGFGRTRSVSNPYRSAGGNQSGSYTTDYDALGRKTIVTSPDGNQQAGNM